MNEEERNKAYQFLQELDKNGYRYTADGREIYIIENVFHKIDKLQKELDSQKQGNKDLVKEGVKLSAKIVELEKELDKKDKVIDSMANEIYIEYTPHFKTTEDVKEYFYKKVKEENE